MRKSNTPKNDEARRGSGFHTGQRTIEQTTQKYNITTPLTLQDLLNAMEKEPLLTDFGIGVYMGRRLSKEEFVREFEHNREALKRNLEEFRLCCAWLSLCQRRKSINPYRSSYGLKHEVERYFGQYVSNGSFIAATIHMGIPYRVYPGSPNIGLAISEKLPVRGAGVHV